MPILYYLKLKKAQKLFFFMAYNYLILLTRKPEAKRNWFLVVLSISCQAGTNWHALRLFFDRITNPIISCEVTPYNSSHSDTRPQPFPNSCKIHQILVQASYS